jgi:tRNA pseudouridine32 synthase/23S rRNA pseudouridine746 synthase/23S rRNA pseudouridine1911/1915/1917 synthase
MINWTDVRDHGVLFEDEHVLVINKPVGISLVGERNDTDLMRQAREAGDWVMPAHRIDKVTSGVVLLARDQPTHGVLTRQFSERTVTKEYLAVVRGTGIGCDGDRRGRIELPLSVGRKNRVRVAAERNAITETVPGQWNVPGQAVFSHVRSYSAETDYTVLAEQSGHSALLLRPHTGRRHQLRVQLAWIGFPIEGDPLFCKPPGERTYLHAWRLTFGHPVSGEPVTVHADPEPSFWQPLGCVPEI